MSGWWWQTKFSVSPGPGLWPLVLGPFGPDLGPDLDLTWDLDLDLSLTIYSYYIYICTYSKTIGDLKSNYYTMHRDVLNI